MSISDIGDGTSIAEALVAAEHRLVPAVQALLHEAWTQVGDTRMAMTREEVLTLLQRFAVEPWSTGDVDALDKLVTDDYTLQGGGSLEDLKLAIREMRVGFPDVDVTLSDVILEGDRVAYRWTMRGTHRGEYEEVAATGKPVTYTGITLLRLQDGRVAEDQFESSSPPIREQLEHPTRD
jgi:predicted ester cyclase